MSVDQKIDKLLEEGIREFRNRNLGIGLRDVTPEQLQKLQTTSGKLRYAGRNALPAAAGGAIGGGIGGGMFGGMPGAMIAAPVMGASVGLGAGIGNYINAGTMSKMSPVDIKRLSQEAEKVYGKPFADQMAQAGKKQL